MHGLALPDLLFVSASRDERRNAREEGRKARDEKKHPHSGSQAARRQLEDKDVSIRLPDSDFTR